MSGDLTRTEHLVMDVIEMEAGRAFSLEELVVRLPELSWSEVFEAVDHLSRRGAIHMTRKGFTYFLTASGRLAACTASI